MKYILIAAIITILLVIIIKTKLIKKTDYVLFYLGKKYYGHKELIEIDDNELKELINNKESFGIFIHQPLCTTSYLFNKIITNFAEKNNMSFYKISFDKMKLTPLGDKIKYYPSFAVYHKGKLIDYLKANKDKDLNYYKNDQEFEKWFSQYVVISSTNNKEK